MVNTPDEKGPGLVPALDGDQLRERLRTALDRLIDPDDDTMPTLTEYGFVWVTADSVIDDLVAAVTGERP